jgi:hypothetical protein
MKIIILLFCITMLTACKSVQETGTASKEFAGTWRVVFRGDYEGSGLLYIKDDGTFTSDNFRLRNVYNNTFTDFSARGNIEIGSIRNGAVLRNTVDIGDFDGNFFKFTASGTYLILDESRGTWNASKN